jgi:adenylate cyclase
MKRKILVSPIWSIVALFFLAYVQLVNPSFVESVRLRYFDTLITNQTAVKNNIYTVNIDEASIDANGQWPWGRDKYAEFIQELYARGAGLVVFNVLMPEADRAGQDHALAAIMGKYPVILNILGSAEGKNTARNPGAAIINSDYIDMIVNYPAVIANVPALENAAIGSGIVNTFPELDGVNRRLPLVIQSQETLYPSVVLEVLRVIAGDPSFQIKLSEFGVDKLRIPQFGIIPTDNLGRVWIDWSQQSTSTSASALPDNFGGAVVIVAPTAAGINNPVATAIGPVYPHELHAAVIGTVFNNSNIERPAWAAQAELVYLVAAGLVLILLSRWTYVGIVAFIILVAASAGGSIFMFMQYHWLVDGIIIPSFLLLVGLQRYIVKFVDEFLQKQKVKKQFGGYVSPKIVDLLAKNPSIIEKGVKKNISITMTDLRGFTPLGESYGADVEGLRQIMNDYMEAITQPVLRNEGTIIKYIGDASLHINGAPFEQTNHEIVAVKTAIEMIDAVEEFNKELAVKGKPPVGMGAGINTGPTVIGNIGSYKRYGYDVLGDSVSTAARLEGQTKPYGVLLILGPETAKVAKNLYHVVELDWLAVKGKTQALTIYTVVWKEQPSTEFWHNHDLFLEKYRSGDWTGAFVQANWLIDNGPRTLVKYYQMMKERIDELAQANIQNFDGVYRATSK